MANTNETLTSDFSSLHALPSELPGAAIVL